MPTSYGAGDVQAYPGAFASAPLFQNGERRMPSAPALGPAYAAPAGGTIQGRFGWGSPASGTVANTRTSASDQLGVVLPLRAQSGAMVIGWGSTWQFYDPAVRALRIRQGLGVTLMSRGDFWMQFDGGAYAGEPVWASLVDGSAISSQTDNAELTPWVVTTNANPGMLAIISTNAQFGD